MADVVMREAPSAPAGEGAAAEDTTTSGEAGHATEVAKARGVRSTVAESNGGMIIPTKSVGVEAAGVAVEVEVSELEKEIA